MMLLKSIPAQEHQSNIMAPCQSAVSTPIMGPMILYHLLLIIFATVPFKSKYVTYHHLIKDDAQYPIIFCAGQEETQAYRKGKGRRGREGEEETEGRQPTQTQQQICYIVI